MRRLRRRGSGQEPRPSGACTVMSGSGAVGGWVCRRCCRFSAARRLLQLDAACAERVGHEVLGPKARRAISLGHVVYGGSPIEHGAFYACMKCGCYAESRFVGLGRARAWRGGSCAPQARRMWERGLHPGTGHAIGPLRRLGPVCAPGLGPAVPDGAGRPDGPSDGGDGEGPRSPGTGAAPPPPRHGFGSPERDPWLDCESDAQESAAEEGPWS